MEDRQSPGFSMSEFKKWLSQQSDVSDFFDLQAKEASENPFDKFIGKEAKARVGKDKLMQRIEPDEGERDELIDDFLENGGVILDLSGRNLLIEVDSGSFYIPRFCVKIRKDD